jgi:chromosome segregation ATPase
MEKIDVSEPLRILSENKQSLEAELRQMMQRLAAIERLQRAGDAIGEAEKELEQRAAHYVDIEQKESTLRSSIKKLEAQQETEAGKLKSLQSAVASEQAKLGEARKEVEAVEARLAELKAEAENFLNRFKS